MIANEIMMPIVTIVVNDLTDHEVLSLLAAVQLRFDPRGRDGYDKARSLFTEEGVRMSATTEECFMQAVMARLLRGVS